MSALRSEGNGVRGAVLVVVVLMALALFALAHGLLLSARHALIAARVGATLVAARADAEEVLERARRSGVGGWADSVSIGGRRVVADTLHDIGSASVVWRRLDDEAWLVSAVVTRRAFPPVTAERLLWAYDPLERTKGQPAALTVGPSSVVLAAGTLQGIDPLAERADAPPELEAACVAWWDAWNAASAGERPALASADRLRLGLLNVVDLVERASELPDSAGTPEPSTTAGVCNESDPWSWGDPDHPGAACGAQFALRGRTGATTVVGGVGQGVIVVDGDLELAAAARFHGVVITSGRLRVTGGARLEGLALARGGAEIEAGAALVGSACRAARALHGVRGRLGVALPLHPARRFGPRG